MKESITNHQLPTCLSADRFDTVLSVDFFLIYLLEIKYYAMKLKEQKLQNLSSQISEIIESAIELEEKYNTEISLVHPNYKKSALNLVHYMALRSYSLDKIQNELRFMGLPAFDNVEGHVMRSLLAIKTIINYLSGDPVNEKRKPEFCRVA